MTATFDVTPEKQASFPRFLHQQVTFRSQKVSDVDLQGKTAIVTGSNCGVGFFISRQLLDLGLGKLILAVRNEDKGKDAVAKLSAGRESLQQGIIEVWKLDLSVYDSVVAFAERTKTLERLDVMVLNAGICPTKRTFKPTTHHDEIIQVNYLSTALLAILLLPVVKAKRANQPGPSRITFTSSEVAAWARFKVGKEKPILLDLDKPGKVDTTDRMFVSKLLGQYFIRELAKRVPPSVAVINAASPSSIHDSEFNRDMDKTFAGVIIKKVLRRIANTSAVGARMLMDAGVKRGEETHGQFLSFQKVVPMAPILYTQAGEDISAQPWKETMEEFSFIHAEDIVKNVSA